MMPSKSEMMMVNKQSSKFSETCSKLSHLLKQRRSLVSLGLVGDHHFPANTNTNTNTNINTNMPVDLNANAMSSCAPTNTTTTTTTTTSMNLFPNKVPFQDYENDNDNRRTNVPNSQQNKNNNATSLDLFPLTNLSLPLTSSTHQSTQSMLPISSSRQVPRSMEESQSQTRGAAKMTIFYGGQVIVFDDLAEDKAEEIMSLAARLRTVASHSETPTQSTLENTTMFEPPTSSTLFDLPMARRVSLRRFMEIRKHRIASASPYQLQRSMHTDHRYELVRHLAHEQQQQQQLELKLF